MHKSRLNHIFLAANSEAGGVLQFVLQIITEVSMFITAPPHAYQDPTGWIKRLVTQHDRLSHVLVIPREEEDQLDESKYNAIKILSSRVHETLDLLTEFNAGSQPKVFADLGVKHYPDDSGNDTVMARSPQVAADILQDALRKAAWELQEWQFWLQEEGASSDDGKVAELIEVIDGAVKAVRAKT